MVRGSVVYTVFPLIFIYFVIRKVITWWNVESKCSENLLQNQGRFQAMRREWLGGGEIYVDDDYVKKGDSVVVKRPTDSYEPQPYTSRPLVSVMSTLPPPPGPYHDPQTSETALLYLKKWTSLRRSDWAKVTIARMQRVWVGDTTSRRMDSPCGDLNCNNSWWWLRPED